MKLLVWAILKVEEFEDGALVGSSIVARPSGVVALAEI
jgi:hypothetical protein